MEGLIPYLYRAFIHKRKGKQPSPTLWLGEPFLSPSHSYSRLPDGDSERYQTSKVVQNPFSSTVPPLPPVKDGTRACRKSTSY
ncbi:hypothetical protein MA16_Dca018277 [Dendrobium catenatum]|uniref:Uncharacterized protein n=1 Tax=Dendrobium catenatum TaxID=906689 RepID=A0A2I0W184_9ASPA|nr:hypothetical protein MA16_Dca018277 [Dendrobium catenatum]